MTAMASLPTTPNDEEDESSFYNLMMNTNPNSAKLMEGLLGNAMSIDQPFHQHSQQQHHHHHHHHQTNNGLVTPLESFLPNQENQNNVNSTILGSTSGSTSSLSRNNGNLPHTTENASTTPAPTTTTAPKFNLACERCRSKKRKCDGVRPVCGNCTKAIERNRTSGGPGGESITCVYPETIKKRGRKKGYREALLDKLNALESLLKPLKESGIVGGPGIPGLQGVVGSGLTTPPNSGSLGQSMHHRQVQQQQHNQQNGFDDDEGDRDDEEDQVPMTSAQALESLLWETSNYTLVQDPSTGAQVLQPNNNNNNSNTLHQGQQQQQQNPFEMFTPRMNQDGEQPTTEAQQQQHPPPARKRRLISAFPNQPDWDFVESIFVTPTLPLGSQMTGIELHEPFVKQYLLDEKFLTAALVPAMIFQNYKSPIKASQHFMKIAEDALAMTIDPIPVIQVMILLGVWDFGTSFGISAYKWVGAACREACKISLHDNYDPFELYRFSVWRNPTGEAAGIEEETRERTWSSVFVVDTITSMVSGLPHALSEMEYAHVLTDRDQWFVKAEQEQREYQAREAAAANAANAAAAAAAAATTEGSSGNSSPSTPSVSFGSPIFTTNSPDSRNGSTSPPMPTTLFGLDSEEVTGLKDWSRMFRRPPADTIYDYLDEGGADPIESRLRTFHLYNRAGVDIVGDCGVDETPPYMKTNPRADAWALFQLMYLIRRIGRLANLKKADLTSKMRNNTNVILSILPTHENEIMLHEAIIQWYDALAARDRAFPSLEAFSNSKNLPTIPSPDGPLPAWIEKPLSCQLQMLFCCGLAVLHDPHSGVGGVAGNGTGRIFRTNPAKHDKLASAFEVGIMAHRALIYVIRCIYASTGRVGGYPPPLDEIEASMKFFRFTKDMPAPPTKLVDTPLVAFCLYSTAFNVLSAVVPAADPLRARQQAHGGGGVRVGANIQVAEVLDCLESIRKVTLPALAQVTRVWRVAEIFFLRIKELMEEVSNLRPSFFNEPVVMKKYEGTFVQVHEMTAMMKTLNTNSVELAASTSSGVRSPAPSETKSSSRMTPSEALSDILSSF
ncbi:hypothetical protein HDU76_002076 [Blyttiomyces sp. JEL0837]|nr:hypothetical protein HDU76_002076 [Blyttiomyces sp. JEL0837]